MYTSYRSQQRSIVRRWPLPWSAMVALIASTALTVLTLAAGRQSNLIPSQQQLTPRNGDAPGNTNVASDIYGLGVRVGVYTQIVGMLFSIASKDIAGIRTAVSSFQIGLMASWTVLAAHKSISPCESVVVLTLNNALVIVDSILSTRKGSDGRDIPGGANLWVLVANFWFWSTLVFQFPVLGTQNATWFFARVSLVGGYRIFLLVLASIGIVLTAIILVLGLVMCIKFRNKIWRGDEDEDGPAGDEDDEEVSTWDMVSRASGGVISLVFVIATVEMTIIYNGLAPETDLSLPGQTIPFAIGLVTLFQGCMAVFSKIVKFFLSDD